MSRLSGARAKANVAVGRGSGDGLPHANGAAGVICTGVPASTVPRVFLPARTNQDHWEMQHRRHWDPPETSTAEDSGGLPTRMGIIRSATIAETHPQGLGAGSRVRAVQTLRIPVRCAEGSAGSVVLRAVGGDPAAACEAGSDGPEVSTARSDPPGTDRLIFEGCCSDRHGTNPRVLPTKETNPCSRP